MTEHRPVQPDPLIQSLSKDGRADPTAGQSRPAVATPITASPRAINDVLSVRDDQINRYGHTPERDLRRPVLQFAQDIENAARAVLEDAQFNKDGARIRRRLVKLAALALATIDRIDNQPKPPGDDLP